MARRPTIFLTEISKLDQDVLANMIYNVGQQFGPHYGWQNNYGYDLGQILKGKGKNTKYIFIHELLSHNYSVDKFINALNGENAKLDPHELGDAIERYLGHQKILMSSLTQEERDLIEDTLNTIAPNTKKLLNQQFFPNQSMNNFYQRLFTGQIRSREFLSSVCFNFTGLYLLYCHDIFGFKFSPEWHSKNDSVLEDLRPKQKMEDTNWLPLENRRQVLNPYFTEQVFLALLIKESDRIFRNATLVALLLQYKIDFPKFNSKTQVTEQDLQEMKKFITQPLLQFYFKYLFSQQGELFKDKWQVPTAPKMKELRFQYEVNWHSQKIWDILNLSEETFDRFIEANKPFVQQFFRYLKGLPNKSWQSKKINLKEAKAALGFPGQAVKFFKEDKFFTNPSFIDFLRANQLEGVAVPYTLPKTGLDMFPKKPVIFTEMEIQIKPSTFRDQLLHFFKQEEVQAIIGNQVRSDLTGDPICPNLEEKITDSLLLHGVDGWSDLANPDLEEDIRQVLLQTKFNLGAIKVRKLILLLRKHK